MDLAAKAKETALSVVPAMALVSALALTVAPIGAAVLGRFLIGGLLLIVGLAVFLAGVDAGIEPFGEETGAALTSKRSLVLLLGAALLVGFIVTAAEPDVQVFGDQVKNAVLSAKKLALTISIALGVGFFLSLGLARIVAKFPLKLALLACYVILGGVAVLSPPSFLGVAFDSGGATTGPMTVPFVMALGLGVARSRGDPDSSFGLTGIASVGPVLAVLVYGCFLSFDSSMAATGSSTGATEGLASSGGGLCHTLFAPFAEAVPSVISESLSSILPLLVLFVVFRAVLFKMGRIQFIRHLSGFAWAFVGLSVFLIGVEGGFMQAGSALGNALGEAALNSVWAMALLIASGAAFGAIVVCAEPAVWVLGAQVEQVSGGTIRRKVLLLFLSIGTALAVALAMWRAVAGFSVAWFLAPGYIIALLLMTRCPALFTGIAFDSGGVASGPLTSTFVLAFALGASSNGGDGGGGSFGVIALVALLPLLAIQTMGILYDRGRRRAVRLSSRKKGEGK